MASTWLFCFFYQSNSFHTGMQLQSWANVIEDRIKTKVNPYPLRISVKYYCGILFQNIIHLFVIEKGDIILKVW